MKHNVPFLIMTFIATVAISLNIYLILNPREILRENKVTKKNSSNLISMMIETTTGNYEEYKDNTWPDAKYKFNETLSGCENGSKLIWDEETRSAKVNAQSSDKCYLYFDHEIFTKYLISLYQKDGDNNMYYHDGVGEYTNSNLETKDFSYRYSGSSASVNNYICFGGECSNNPNDAGYKYLYRIIGLFKNNADQYELKIIKADGATKEDLGDKDDPVGSAYSGVCPYGDANYKGKNYAKLLIYYWNNTNSGSVNMWKDSNLNKINLNTKFYDSIAADYKKIIARHTWVVGGTTNYGNAKEVYESELGTQKITSASINCYTEGNALQARQCNELNDLTYDSNIGLMYISDYMYGTLPQYWNTISYDYRQDVVNNNWLYLGLHEWTISRITDNGSFIRNINILGFVESRANCVSNHNIARPVLYLSSDVKITGGLGTEKNPYKIAIN